jgi:hypothetical protein
MFPTIEYSENIVKKSFKDNAKTSVEIGLRPPNFPKRLISLRDYKPRALNALIAANVVQVTEAGKMYLYEEKLMNLKP